MVGGVSAGRCAGVDLQRPRQGGGSAVEFLVEVVAPPPPDRLGQNQSGGECVAEVQQVDPAPSQPIQAPTAPRATAPPDAEAAVPDVERLDRIPTGQEVQLGGR